MKSLIAACLSFAGLAAFQSNAIAAADGPNYLLKGIKIISYRVLIEKTVGGEQCKINYNNLNASLKFIANQSTSLRIVTEREHIDRTTELFQKATKLANGPNEKRVEAYKAAEDYNWMPFLFIVIDPFQLPGGCAGHIDATLQGRVTNSKLVPTGAVVPRPTIAVWSKNLGFVAPQKVFSEYATSRAEQLFKAFVNDWTASQQ